MRGYEVHRVNLELGPKSYKELKRLQAATEASSKADVIRIALQVLSKLTDEAKGGGRILIKRPDGEQVEVILTGTG